MTPREAAGLVTAASDLPPTPPLTRADIHVLLAATCFTLCWLGVGGLLWWVAVS